ncbi:hypothetical protein [Brevundimonas sp.]|uniref:hypothetical protein n=1 Tax=Brevundimonas sp. TaxID=1871086 RepID=UPI002C864BBF|nr:hypothetical protein [Brevundimonas sp.]HWQ86552.1 hypothetical protein [Brevundimonas sp.]
MKTLFRCVLSFGAVVALSGCSSDLVTGGPLIRPGEPQGVIRVINATSDQLHAVLISSCSASTYGLNRLPNGMAIPSGGAYSFTVSAGCWDIAGGTLGVGDARGRLQVRPGQTSSIRIQ